MKAKPELTIRHRNEAELSNSVIVYTITELDNSASFLWRIVNSEFALPL